MSADHSQLYTVTNIKLTKYDKLVWYKKFLNWLCGLISLNFWKPFSDVAEILYIDEQGPYLRCKVNRRYGGLIESLNYEYLRIDKTTKSDDDK